METSIDELIDNVKQLYELALQGNESLKDILEIDDETLERIYTNGYHYNLTGHYVKALKHFRTLVLFDPDNPKYLLALAMVLHQRKYYRKAAAVYMVCASKDPKNPLPWYHMADCNMHLEKTLEAFGCLEHVMNLSSTQSEYDYLAIRAELLMKALKNSGIIQKIQEEDMRDWEEWEIEKDEVE